MNMNRLCVSAVRFHDTIIYRNDLNIKKLNDFIESKEQYLECQETNVGNIYLENNIVLQEWEKYNVKSLSGSFKPEDFLKIGEFGTENFGRLIFKNCIGIAKFKNMLLFIESYKITINEMNQLIETVNNYIINLSYDYNQPTYSSIERDFKHKTDLNYHIFLMINTALSSADKGKNIFNNFKLIENNPCRTMTSSIEYNNISNITELSDEAIVEIFSGTSALQEYNGENIMIAEKLYDGYRKYLPKEIMYEEIVDTFDNAENRFVKFFLKWCLKIITAFQKDFLKEDNFINVELIENNDKHIKKMKIILQQSFLKNVGELQSIPMYSNVLTRRDGYRQIFQFYLGILSIPINVDQTLEIKELLENKPLDILYENFCYFRISDIIATIYKQKLEKKKYKVLQTEYTKAMEKKTNSNYFVFDRTKELPKIEVHYNKTYTKESYSKSFDPDISIEIFDEFDNLNAIYVFDAKFRTNIYELNIGEDIVVRKKYKYDDINKMHTYKDALRLAKGAFVLYPGTDDELFFESDEDKDLLYGVGAFGLRPVQKLDLDKIKIIIERLLMKYKLKG